jgi:hypothetical protein
MAVPHPTRFSLSGKTQDPALHVARQPGAPHLAPFETWDEALPAAKCSRHKNPHSKIVSGTILGWATRPSHLICFTTANHFRASKAITTGLFSYPIGGAVTYDKNRAKHLCAHSLQLCGEGGRKVL